MLCYQTCYSFFDNSKIRRRLPCFFIISFVLIKIFYTFAPTIIHLLRREYYFLLYLDFLYVSIRFPFVFLYIPCKDFNIKLFALSITAESNEVR